MLCTIAASRDHTGVAEPDRCAIPPGRPVSRRRLCSRRWCRA